jgi:prepilin-type N-terminal cleavage/methylation domain-containing protein
VKTAFRGRAGKNKGLTIIELIVVIAILAILMAFALPAFTGIKEKAANQTDGANAKQIARQLEYFYAANPEAVERLLKIEPETPGAMEILVLQDGMIYSTHTDGGKGCKTAVDKAVEADMKELLGDYDQSGYNKSVKCKSNREWKQYAVCVSCWNQITRSKTSVPNIYYTAWDAAAYDGGYQWDNIINGTKKSVSVFKTLCGGDRILE